MTDGEPTLPFGIGDLIADKYRVESVLGAGGMGVVVAAMHLDLDRKVAIKLIREELAQENSTVERLMLEAKAAAKIRSEHVGKVLDVGRLPSGAPYIVMEHLEGHDLCHQLEQHGALKITQAIDFVMQACEALAEAHAANIVHRDLKPENLFVARQADGTSIIKVLDFGISKQLGSSDRRQLTNPSTAVGSPRYMAPEQMQAGAVDVRADIWSLGAILYECVSNSPAFDSDTLPGICAQVLSQEPRPIRELAPHVPDRLATIIARCMCKNRDERFANVAELAEGLAPFGTERAALSRRRITTLLGLGSVDSTQLVDVQTGVDVDIQARTAVVDTGSVLAAMAASSPAATQVSTTVGRGVSVDVAAGYGIAGLPKRRATWPFIAVPLVAVAALAGAYLMLGGGDTASTEESTASAVPSAFPEQPATPNVLAIQPIDEGAKDNPSDGEDLEGKSGGGDANAGSINVTPSANTLPPTPADTSPPSPVTNPPSKKSPPRPPKDAPKKAPSDKAPDAWDPENFGGRQ